MWMLCYFIDNFTNKQRLCSTYTRDKRSYYIVHPQYNPTHHLILKKLYEKHFIIILFGVKLIEYFIFYSYNILFFRKDFLSNTPIKSDTNILWKNTLQYILYFYWMRSLNCYKILEWYYSFLHKYTFLDEKQYSLIFYMLHSFLWMSIASLLK